MRITRILRPPNEKARLKRAPTGAAPGTLLYTGQREMESIHVHLTHYDQEHFDCKTAIDAIPEDNAPVATTSCGPS